MVANEGVTFYYWVHGTAVRANRPIPALRPGAAASGVALDIWLGPFDDLRRRRPDADWSGITSWERSPSSTVRRTGVNGDVVLCWRFDENQGVFAYLAAGGESIEIGWQGHSDASAADLERVVGEHFLTGLLGMALRLSGQLVLHGNVVRIGGKAVAWLGAKGAGKSTLAAAFVAANVPLLADDQFVVSPGQDGFGIPHGIKRLHLTAESYVAMSRAGGQYHFDQPFGPSVKGYVVADTSVEIGSNLAPAPLAAIYVLQPRRAELRTPQFTTPAPGEQLHLVLTNCLARKTLPLSAIQQRHEFALVGDLVRKIPVRLLDLPDDLDRLPEVVELLVAEHRNG
jgi:hypothetical protein